MKSKNTQQAPRVTLDDINANIDREYYFTAANGVDGADIHKLRDKRKTKELVLEPLANDPDLKKTKLAPLTLLTFCVLVLKNGFTVTGESACVSPENFDAELGKKIAREHAVDKVWTLMGYELRSKVAGGGA